ncbi:response regulator [bacterium]|nr:response regulator [bacterium]RQV93805.1 MAG: response regulator [bacterium]
MSQVLIVDDEKNVLKTLSIGLKRSDFTVREARNGKEAFKIMEEDMCEIVVSDIRMAPMDGYTMVSQLREKYPQVRIILMSAYGFDEEDPEKKMLYQYPRLTKPFTVAELVRFISNEQCLYYQNRINQFEQEP